MGNNKHVGKCVFYKKVFANEQHTCTLFHANERSNKYVVYVALNVHTVNHFNLAKATFRAYAMLTYLAEQTFKKIL